MGRKKKDAGIGTSVIRDRFGGRSRNTGKGDSFLHTSELQDGADWGRLNLQSVTEQSNLEEFLSTAQLAGTEFVAERMNITIIEADKHSGLPSNEELRLTEKAHREHRELLTIPRRPMWDETTTADELEVNERTEFLEWRRKLAELQEKEHLILTPFERNLDFWRQLWRVIERSDVVVQIVDARNPLLFRCSDLEKYVKEVNEEKVNVILVNKADLLSEEQRKYWAEYFDSINLKAVFWSAVRETERCAEEQKKLDEVSESEEDESESEGTEEEEEDEEEESTMEADGEPEERDELEIENVKEKGSEKTETTSSIELQQRQPTINVGEEEGASGGNTGEERGMEGVTEQLESVSTHDSVPCDSSDKLCGQSVSTVDSSTEAGNVCPPSISSQVKNSSELLTGDELIATLRGLHSGSQHTPGVTTLGLVGYPNVGKSSSINAILQAKKVPVSATPGRTKHFQTLFVDKTTLLCDCPGLVMPTFVTTKAEMVISGILPIDQMRDYVPPTSLVCLRIPRVTLEMTYGIILPPPGEGEDPDRPPNAMELLNAYGYMRGFMTHKGIPDYSRAARHVLKDYMNGKLLYSHAPPGVSEEDYMPAAPPQKTAKLQRADHSGQSKKTASLYTKSVDQHFFQKTDVKMGKKGKASEPAPGPANQFGVIVAGKKHFKRGKKEKLRRLHGHLDA